MATFRGTGKREETVLNRRPLVANLLSSAPACPQTGRLVSGLGSTSMSPQVADAAKKASDEATIKGV